MVQQRMTEHPGHWLREGERRDVELRTREQALAAQTRELTERLSTAELSFKARELRVEAAEQRFDAGSADEEARLSNKTEQLVQLRRNWVAGNWRVQALEATLAKCQNEVERHEAALHEWQQRLRQKEQQRSQAESDTSGTATATRLPFTVPGQWFSVCWEARQRWEPVSATPGSVVLKGIRLLLSGLRAAESDLRGWPK